MAIQLRFRHSVALYNTLAAGIIIALAFAGIYTVAYTTDYSHLNSDLQEEMTRLHGRLAIRNDSILIDNPAIGAMNLASRTNPLLVQLANQNGRIIYRSINIPGAYLLQSSVQKNQTFADIVISEKHFRQGIFPVMNDKGMKIGVATLAISREESWVVLSNLLLVLSLSYPLVLIGLYFFLLFSVKKALVPIKKLIIAASAINDTNISMRLPVPEKKDDIYHLATTMNDLLARIEKSMKNQKQFTADASHEMRTPLSAIRGILEVLIRRKREAEHYERGVKEAIAQVDKMHLLLEHLLQLSRLSAGVVPAKFTTINLCQLVTAVYDKWKDKIEEKKIRLLINIPGEKEILSDISFLAIIIENLLSNAIKYGKEGGQIILQWEDQKHCLSVTDDGIGIASEHLPHLFERFYRTDDSRNSKVPGYGLGLALVDKIAHLLSIRITVSSIEGIGTNFSLYFNSPS